LEVFVGSSPANLTLKSSAGFFKHQQYKVKIKLDGFPERLILVSCSVSGWYIAGNIVFGGLIGWLIVDPATGAMWKLDREIINEDFTKSASSISPSLKILNINEIPDSMKAHLICISK